jgi:hypothetical protein
MLEIGHLKFWVIYFIELACYGIYSQMAVLVLKVQEQCEGYESKQEAFLI